MNQESPNPYQAPQVEDVAAEPSEYFVDMPYLVVKSGTRLPQRCVITNVPVSGYRETNLQYPSRWYRVAIGNRRCKILWSVDEDIHKRQRRRSHSNGLAVIGSIGLFLAVRLIDMGLGTLLFTVPLVLGCFGLSVYFRSQSLPLPYAEKYRGGYFWIAGLSPEFLSSLLHESS